MATTNNPDGYWHKWSLTSGSTWVRVPRLWARWNRAAAEKATQDVDKRSTLVLVNTIYLDTEEDTDDEW